MRQQIVRDTLEPARPQGIEASQFDRIEEIPSRRLGRAMLPMDRASMKASPQRQAIAERAQAAEGCGIRAPQHGVSVVGAGKRACARADGLDEAIGEWASHVASVTARARPLLGQVLAHAALVVLGDERALVFVAAVEK